MKSSLQIVSRDKTETLPVLATATDVREAIRFLKHHPEGIATVQAMDATRKRIFDARKVSAYEFWKILLKNGERLKLTPLGWELAQCLNPEAEIYRAVLNDTPAYHGVLEWIREQDLELVTHLDVGEYWRKHHPHVLQGDSDEQLEAHAASFFQICHEAEVGALTVGRKGQPTRLHIYPHELDAYLRGVPANNPEKILVRKAQSRAPRVFISHATTPGLVKHIINGLELADLQFETVDRTEQWSIDKTLAVLGRCEAGVIVITGDAIDNQLLLQIGAAMVQFERRLLLVVRKGLNLPSEIGGVQRCEVEDEITWDTGLELMRALKRLKAEAT
jgi:hypothetical protein